MNLHRVQCILLGLEGVMRLIKQTESCGHTWHNVTAALHSLTKSKTASVKPSDEMAGRQTRPLQNDLWPTPAQSCDQA